MRSDLERKLRSAYDSYLVVVQPRLSPRLVTLLLIAGDRRFFRHGGIDVVATTRAVLSLLGFGKLHGGSTIEQQLVRTLTARYERTLGRKAREIVLAARVAGTIPKEHIPGVYLSVAYFGWRSNGVVEACQRFGVDLMKLTEEEAASLIARLKYPEPRSAPPGLRQQILQRSDYILHQWRRDNPPGSLEESADARI